MVDQIKAAVFGARGYVGAELIQMLDRHPQVELCAAYSREHAGVSVKTVIPKFSDPVLTYQVGDFEALDQLGLDVLFVALPDGLAKAHCGLWDRMSDQTVIIDLSSDHRFDPNWVYGQPESNQAEIGGARLIANPGCYATGAQLGLRPLLPLLTQSLADVPTVFGVSGYSGAGTKPSDKNNPERLQHNILAYQPTGHTHEREVSHVLEHPIRFMPHVAAHFRGIHLTISGSLHKPMSEVDMQQLFSDYYQDDPLVEVSTNAPEIQHVADQHGVRIGGFAMSATEPGHFVLNVCLDNLLKGAATQAIQNMNLACAGSFNTKEFTGINHEQH